MACYDDPALLSVEDCRTRMLDVVSVRLASKQVAPEPVALAAACGRVTAEAILARMDVPPADNSAMDGYALHADDLAAVRTATQVLTLVGQSLAGHPFAGTLQAGQCLRIMTGALVPAGAAAVVMQEDVARTAEGISLGHPVRAGDHIRRRGEDVRAGELLLPARHRLTPADIGLLASQGITTVSVQRRLRIAVLSTGDELVPPGQPLGPGQIHDSNRIMLQAALAQYGFEVIDGGHVRDDRDALLARFRGADGQADVVMTTGGVSVGDADLVREVIGELGDIHVWRIAIKPGKPFAFGLLPDSVFMGLPGNPVSALVTLSQLALPALMRMQGVDWSPPMQLPATLLAPVKKKPGRAEYQRGVLTQDATGALQVMPLNHQGSGVLNSMSRADCFIVLAREQGGLVAGEQVSVEPFGAG